MKTTVSLKISGSQKAWLDAEATKAGISRSAFLRRLLPAKQVGNKPVKEEKEPASGRLNVWLRAAEKRRLAEHLQSVDERVSMSAFVRSLIRRELSMPKELTKKEVDELSNSVYQLRAIGRNLNQITSAVNAGDSEMLDNLTARYLERIAVRIEDVSHKTAVFVASHLRGDDS